MRFLAIRVGIIAAILGAGWIFRDYFTGNATDLAVGDCFDIPSSVDQTVDEVSHHPCTDAHTAEVIFVADYEAGSYPDVSAFDAFTEANCPPAFNTYSGLDFYAESGKDYDIGVFYPIEEGWSGGDHEITCYLVRVDEGPMSSSLRKR